MNRLAQLALPFAPPCVQDALSPAPGVCGGEHHDHARRWTWRIGDAWGWAESHTEAWAAVDAARAGTIAS